MIAWIGEDNGAPDRRAIRFVKELSAKAGLEMGLIEGTNDSSNAPLSKETARWVESITPFGLVNSIWLEFLALIKRPWFSRIWIVQEVVMGKKVTVRCGPHQFDWKDLFVCSIFVDKHTDLLSFLAAPACLKEHDPKDSEFYESSKPLCRLRDAARNIRSIGLLSALQQMQTMVRDMVELGVEEPLARSTPDNLYHWGMLSPDTGKIRIYSNQPPESGSSPPPLHDTSFIRHHLLPPAAHERPGDLIAIVNSTIPIYTAIPNTPISPTTPSPPPRESGPPSLYSLTACFRAFDATDPRDKVYALLGMAAQVRHIARLPAVSYAPDTSVLDVVWGVIEAELRERGSLAFLGDACGVDGRGGGGGVTPGEEFPSWMPLWYDAVSHVRTTAETFGALEVKGLVRYAAGGAARRSVGGDE